MSIWYIKQEDTGLWKKLFNIITLKEIQNKTVATLPYGNLDKLANKLCGKLYDKENQNLVLSKDLMGKESFVNYLNANNINILNGRWLFSYLTEEILAYIAEKSEKELQTMEISVMVNDNSEKNLKIIINIASKVKMLNIITNHIEAFRKIEEYLYDKQGILVRITNNTKKSLLKTNVILNLDFPEELVNKYSLPKKTIVVNIGEAVNIRSKRFAGINANFYEVEFPEENELVDSFETEILYESILYKKASYESIREQIRVNKSKIKNLVGINGIICEKEYKDLW